MTHPSTVAEVLLDIEVLSPEQSTVTVKYQDISPDTEVLPGAYSA